MKRFTQKILLVLLSLGMTIALSAQNKVTGVVTDENGEPLMGAGVFVEGTTVGVVTGLDGDYEIVLPEATQEENATPEQSEEEQAEMEGSEEIALPEVTQEENAAPLPSSTK